MEHFFSTLYKIIASPYLLVTVVTISFFVKVYVIKKIVAKGSHTKTVYFQLFLLLSILIGSMFGDVAWITRGVRRLWFAHSSLHLVHFIIRIAWGFTVLQLQALTLFMHSLVDNKFNLKFGKTITTTISVTLFAYYLYAAFFFPTDNLNSAIPDGLKPTTAWFEHTMMQYTVFYLIALLIIQGLYLTFKRLNDPELPKILRRQLKFFIVYLMCPYLLIEFMQALFISFTHLGDYVTPAVNLSTMHLIFAISYCMNRVMGFRFLNIANHVESFKKIKSIADFKQVIEQLSHATSTQELGHITQAFFKEKFHVPLHYTTLHIRQQTNDPDELLAHVEHFMNSHDQNMCTFIKNNKILIYDEIAFNNFYEQNKVRNKIVTFLTTTDTDVFLPIYIHKKLSAYIVIKRDARGNECYSDIERDEMLVFSSHLSNIIHMLQNKHVDTLIYQAKELKEKLYAKEQHIKQYQESIRSFLRKNKEYSVGIVCYKNRRFIFGNHAAKEMIQVNLNRQEGHPLTKIFKELARKVESYKAPQATIAHNADGTMLMISAVQHLEQKMVIMTVSYPGITDIISQHSDQLKNPVLRDHLLYLQTTQAGKLIEQMIPSNTDTFLNFKIELLSTALHKRPVLINTHEEDTIPIVELLHAISQRETLHVLNLHKPVTSFDIAINLFGINQLFGKQPEERPLLERLNKNGTLFIKNIHYLDLKSQRYLAEYIRSGFYRTFKSDQKKSSDVRIICSSDQNLHVLAQEERFSDRLINCLEKNSIVMPSLNLLPETELFDLSDGYAEQYIQSYAFKKLLALTDKDKNKIAHKHPQSLQELKKYVQQILIQKSKQNNIYRETQFDPAYQVSDPELIEAARLGKLALKDRKIMSLLWNKFKNQNKIATFLGVNRSSVNRRCKEYNLLS